MEASTIYVDPAEVDDPDTTAQVLVDVLGGRKSDYLEAVTAGNTRYSEIKEKADAEVGERMEEAVAELTATGGAHEGASLGIHCKAEWKREYPNGQVGGQVIGACNLEVDPGQQPRVLHGHIGAGAVLRRHPCPARRATPAMETGLRRHAHLRGQERVEGGRGRPGHHHLAST